MSRSLATTRRVRSGTVSPMPTNRACARAGFAKLSARWPGPASTLHPTDGHTLIEIPLGRDRAAVAVRSRTRVQQRRRGPGERHLRQEAVTRLSAAEVDERKHEAGARPEGHRAARTNVR